MSNTCGCSRPTRAGYAICETCKGELEQHLAEIPWLDDELDVSLTRAKGVDYNRVGGRGTEKPLPWNERASRARHELKTELVSWFRILWRKGEPIPADNLIDVAAWLQSRLNEIAKRDDAWTIWDQITRASLFARSVVFAKPAPKQFIGPCEGRVDDDGEPLEVECDGEIFLTEGANQAECDVCLRAYDPAEALKARDEKIADRLMTSTEIAHLAHRTFGQPVKRVQRLVSVWANPKRRRITPHSHTEDGTALFRYGDVVRMLTDRYGERGA